MSKTVTMNRSRLLGRQNCNDGQISVSKSALVNSESCVVAPSGGPRDTTVCTIAQEGCVSFVGHGPVLTRVRTGARPGGPPQRSVVRGRSGRRPGHGVTGTTPAPHSGRAQRRAPRTQGSSRGSHSAIRSWLHCRGRAGYRHNGRNLHERHWRHVSKGEVWQSVDAPPRLPR